MDLGLAHGPQHREQGVPLGSWGEGLKHALKAQSWISAWSLKSLVCASPDAGATILKGSDIVAAWPILPLLPQQWEPRCGILSQGMR